ncbi:MAG TPA: MBL fold metallo-hydrolase [Terrimicrobiaceae bacterium]|nr:MBL fold metallo-hydrolase [Terrimicrobiaceae bacterium]
MEQNFCGFESLSGHCCALEATASEGGFYGAFRAVMSKSKNQLQTRRGAILGAIAETTVPTVRRSVRLVEVLIVLGFWMTMSELYAGLQHYRGLIVADQDPTFVPPKTGVRITYLGTNAYLLQSRDAALLVDPYFSRAGLFRAAWDLPVASSRSLIERYLPVRRIDAVLVTHGHFDHLLDVPEIVALTGARLIASATSVQLARSAGVPSEKCVVVTAGEKVSLRGATVNSLPAKHDRLFGRVPFDGPVRRLPPRTAGDWVCGEPLAFLIEMGGRRIYIAAGGRPNGDFSASLGRIDLAILGVALPDSRKRLAQTLEQLRPRYVLPSHQDNFFLPLSRGFVFGPMTDFPGVIRVFQSAPTGSRLILVDYFRPWTLP